MAKFTIKKQANVQEIEESKLSVADILIDTKDFLEYYERDDYKEFASKLSSCELPDFQNIFTILRKYKNIKTVGNLNDATVEFITAKRNEIRNAINTVIGVKDAFSDKKRLWEEIDYLTTQMYERTKDKILISEDVRSLKNSELRIAEVNFQLDSLIKVMDKIGIIMIRFKQVQDELKDTLLYLQVVMDEMSRMQSAVQLALDTGEMEKVFWRKNNDSDRF